MKNIEVRRKEAEKRNHEYDSLTAKQKLLRLDLMFGEGQGARRERAKLAMEVVQEANSKGESVSGMGNQKPKKNYQKPKRS